MQICRQSAGNGCYAHPDWGGGGCRPLWGWLITLGFQMRKQPCVRDIKPLPLVYLVLLAQSEGFI